MAKPLTAENTESDEIKFSDPVVLATSDVKPEEMNTYELPDDDEAPKEMEVVRKLADEPELKKIKEQYTMENTADVQERLEQSEKQMRDYILSNGPPAIPPPVTG